MADRLSTRARPEVVIDDDGALSNPPGWSLVVVANDATTVVAAWDDHDTFHQWEPTSLIVRQLIDALTQMQVVLEAAVTQ